MIPVICAGKFHDPDLAERSIANHDVDMMGIGRALLAHPEMANKIKEGEIEDIRLCVGCHQGCFSRFLSGQPLTCAVNPTCGREEEAKIEKAAERKHQRVFKSGPFPSGKLTDNCGQPEPPSGNRPAGKARGRSGPSSSPAGPAACRCSRRQCPHFERRLACSSCARRSRPAAS